VDGRHAHHDKLAYPALSTSTSTSTSDAAGDGGGMRRGSIGSRRGHDQEGAQGYATITVTVTVTVTVPYP
jgi:hypothetical protein